MGEHDILSVLRSFFIAMGKWERECKALFRRAETEADYEEAKQRSLLELKRIFETHCRSSESPARARYGAPHFSHIPTYGVDLEEVLNVEVYGDKARVLTRQTVGPKFQLIYSLTKTEHGWRIEDNRKILKADGREDDWDL